MTSEFQCIKSILNNMQVQRDDTLVRSGDDCAVLQIPAGCALAVSMDTMVAGRHFFADVAPRDLGYKLLAVNLSDIAAMAATPAWATVALTTPAIDMDWVHEFLCGFKELQVQHNVELIGGDITKGPLTLTCEIHGFIDPEKIVTRQGAKPGDLICVTGTLGAAAYAVVNRESDAESQRRLNRPTPRINEALACQPWMTAAIDISDGLLADLEHICEASGCGAKIDAATIPLADIFKKMSDQRLALQYALTGGDDYELCFTVSCADDFNLCQQALRRYDCELTCIGQIEKKSGVSVELNHEAVIFEQMGFQHF